MSLFTFSDIHGDMYLLLTLLRDVAKVICLNGQDIFDEYTNVSVDDVINSNDFLCNYTWCGNSNKIVIVGDLLDNYRESYSPIEKVIHRNKEVIKVISEFLHEEIKILFFLSEMKKLAKLSGGDIIICSGNHEVFNILGFTNNMYYNYVSPYSKKNNIYKKKRKEYLSTIHGYEIFKALDLKLIHYEESINGIFIHGGFINNDTSYLPSNSENIHSLSSFIDEVNKHFLSQIRYYCYKNPKKYDIAKTYLKALISSEHTILNYRGYSSYSNNDVMCNTLIDNLSYLSNKNQQTTQLKLIVGHCPNILYFNNLKKTCTYIIQDKLIDNKYITFKGNQKIMEENFTNNNQTLVSNNHCNTSNIFGITFDCAYSNTLSPILYRLDCASSKSFHPYNIVMKMNVSNDNLYLLLQSYILPILPQLLEFDTINDNIYIKRLKLSEACRVLPIYKLLFKNWKKMKVSMNKL